ncbi:iron-siderophore ABC transporter substrate-binding protein [Ornithinimicrobium sp. F0845]|uniref:ABC transporter substrate-binding protein n=1 Tax=Ornithinimicrobium sp. F0845 TaxID=2926412 RepID=UPI001FF5A9FF|nr:iron-siderophore ABC transporter substrate-binding protein [Ornithinimicrobium sp. F0845]MCK0111526.1 iron-siderophore ABC transporter substrate-binding protein [Ornithinimicrobium sp. F0845]
MHLPRPVHVASLAVAAALTLTACGTTEDAATDDGDTQDAGGGGPVTLTDERGEHTLDGRVEDVVSLEWGLTENLLTLGIVPVGQADVEGYNTWATVVPLDPEATTDVGTRGEPSMSDITALDPDLIVTTTDIPENVIAQLEDIAPVLTVRGSDAEDPLGYMRETVELLGAATGREAEAEEALNTFDEKLAEGRAAIAEAGLDGAEFTMADGWIVNGVVSVRMYTPGSYFGAIGEELGMVNAWPEGGDPDYGLAQTDIEGLTALEDVQFMYVANDASGEDDPFTAGVEGNAIWEQLPFVTSGTVHRLPDGIWMFGGPESGAAFIDAAVDALTQ